MRPDDYSAKAARDMAERLFPTPGPEHEYAMDDLDRWSVDNWNVLPAPMRERCLAHLRSTMTDWPDVVTKWQSQAARGMSIGSDDTHFHFSAGMAIRNVLRQVVTDDKLPGVEKDHKGGPYNQGHNWDDFYMGALHAFASEKKAPT